MSRRGRGGSGNGPPYAPGFVPGFPMQGNPGAGPRPAQSWPAGGQEIAGPIAKGPPRPPPHWTSTQMGLRFQPTTDQGYANLSFGDTADVSLRAVWQSPIFDLRPDLGGNYRPEASKIPGAARMHLQVWRQDNAFLTTIPSSMEIYSLEAGHVVNPLEIRYLEERLDISTDFYQGTESSILEWAPPGAPLRFWRVAVIFDWFDAATTPPGLMCWASAH